MAKAVFGMVNTADHAELIVNHLKDAGFREADVSVLMPDHRGTLEFAHTHSTKAPEGATAGASAGGLVGAGLGWLAGIGVLAIPGVGPLLAAGPIFAALSAGAVGAALGGITGALVGMGIPEFEAKLYEGKIKSGSILVAVHCRDGKEVHRAREIFGNAGAHDITDAEPVTVKHRKD